MSHGPVSVRILSSLYDKVGVERKYETFRDFFEEYKEHLVRPEFERRYSPDKQKWLKPDVGVPLFLPCVMDGLGVRHENVESVTLAVFDLDGTPYAVFRDFLAAMSKYEGWLYTTWSHDAIEPGQPRQPDFTEDGAPLREATVRVRLICPLDEPVKPEQYAALRAGLVEISEGVLKAPAAKEDKSAQSNIAQKYYLPVAISAENRTVSEYIDGEVLSSRQLLQLGGRALRERSTSDIDRDDTTTDVTLADLKSLSATLARRRDQRSREIAAVLRAVTRREVYTEERNRDTYLWRCAFAIGEFFLAADPNAVAELFRPSIEATNLLLRSGNTEEDVAKVAEKIGRAQRDRHELLAKEQDAEADQRAELIQEAFAAAGVTRTHGYTADERADWAQKLKCTERGLLKRLIVQHERAFYVFFNGAYLPPVTYHSLVASVRRDLSPAYEWGLTLDEGDPKHPKSVEKLMEHYGTVARDSLADLTAQASYYDGPRQTMVEAPCPLRPLTGEYNPLVDEWLQVIAGREYQRLVDWLSVVTDLDRACAILYLAGVKGAGKSMLAKGLSRLYTTGAPSPMTYMLSSFNDAQLRNPIVLADEFIPKELQNNTGKLRFLQQETDTLVNRKGLPLLQVKGARRFIIAANNEGLLDTNENLTTHDVEAIAERVLFIAVPDGARDWLLEHDGVAIFEHFVREDGVAKHALWLKEERARRIRENTDLLQSRRFFVSGDSKGFAARLASATGIRARINQWAVSYLTRRGGRIRDDGARVADGKLWLTPRVVYDKWEIYLPREKAQPQLSDISAALEGLSDETCQFADTPQVSYFGLNTDHLIAWSTQTAYAAEREVLAALGREPVEPEPVSKTAAEVLSRPELIGVARPRKVAK